MPRRVRRAALKSCMSWGTHADARTCAVGHTVGLYCWLVLLTCTEPASAARPAQRWLTSPPFSGRHCFASACLGI
eukprot:357003-Chlamydomonas_euryale.AAC.2